MASGYDAVIDLFVLVGLLSFPAYLVYWVRYHLGGERRRRLWIGFTAFLAWCAATYFCFVRLMLECLGGNCGGRVSPFLELAILYAVSSLGLMLMLHLYRARG